MFPTLLDAQGVTEHAPLACGCRSPHAWLQLKLREILLGDEGGEVRERKGDNVSDKVLLVFLTTPEVRRLRSEMEGRDRVCRSTLLLDVACPLNDP
jgi:hypothetical protein